MNLTRAKYAWIKCSAQAAQSVMLSIEFFILNSDLTHFIQFCNSLLLADAGC